MPQEKEEQTRGGGDVRGLRILSPNTTVISPLGLEGRTAETAKQHKPLSQGSEPLHP